MNNNNFEIWTPYDLLMPTFSENAIEQSVKHSVMINSFLKGDITANEFEEGIESFDVNIDSMRSQLEYTFFDTGYLDILELDS